MITGTRPSVLQVRFFGEDPKDFKPQEVMRIIGTTAKEYETAKKELAEDKHKKVRA